VASGVSFVGFVVTHEVPRDPLFGGLLPPILRTASHCLARPIPDGWCLSWWRAGHDERVRAVEALGAPAEQLDALVRVADRLFEEGEIELDVVRTEAALRAILGVLRGGSALRVLGVALPDEHVDALVPGSARSEPVLQALLASLAARRPLPPGGTVLGYEPLCAEPSALLHHSWLCNGLVPLLEQRLGAVPNGHGLVADARTAAALCRVFNAEQLGEPGVWLPWLLVDYTAAFG
jgi:hypothetical protein